MSTQWLLILQSVMVSLQFINTEIAATKHDTTVALILGAVVSGMQVYLQHVGNQTIPPPTPQEK